MKLKLQTGGVISYTPFIPNSGAQQTTSQSSSSEKSKKITGTLQEEIIKVLNENGIQSDVDSFLATANSFLQQSSTLSSMSLFGGQDDNYTMNHLMGVLSLANKVKRNKEQWTEAVGQLKNQGAAHEVAMSSDGGIYVLTDKGLSTVTPDEYYKNKDKYYKRALTNSQLLGLREKDSNLAFNFDILSDVSDTLVDIIGKFGSNTLQGYVQKTGDQVSQSIWDGMQSLIANGPDGYYKAKSKSEKDNMTSAIKYLWRSLGSDGQKRLMAETAIAGENPNRDYVNLILEAFQNHTDYELTSDFDKSASDFDPDGDKKGNGGSGNYTEDTLAEKYASGNGLPPAKYDILMTSKSGVPMYIYSQNAGPIRTNDNKKNFGNANLQDVLVNGYGMSDVDQRSITFGDIPIDWSDASKIVYDGSTNIKRVYMPFINDNGKIRPNLKLYQEISDLNENILNQGWNEGQIKTFVASRPDLSYDNTTKTIVAKNSQLFLTFGGIASDDTFGNNLNDSNWLIPQSSEIDQNWKDEYNFLTGFENKEKNSRELNRKKTDWLFGYKFYKGNIFVPITDPMIASSIYNNQFWNKSDYMDMTNKAEASMRANIRNSNSELITNF